MDDGSKRKRAAVQDITLPSKRQALTQALTPEAIRQQIKEIYAAYDALNRLDPQGQGGETEYAVLLTAANGKLQNECIASILTCTSPVSILKHYFAHAQVVERHSVWQLGSSRDSPPASPLKPRPPPPHSVRWRASVWTMVCNSRTPALPAVRASLVCSA